MTTSGDGRVVLTGCGWVTPVAAGAIETVVPALEAAGPLALDGDAPFRAIPDEWVGRYEELSKEIRRDRGAWIAAIAAQHALEDASLAMDALDGDRVGLVLGVGLAGQQGMIGFATEVREQSARFVSPIHFPQTVGNYVAGALSRGFGYRGPNLTLAGGVQSGLLAMIEGHSLIAAGEADVVLAGGAEQLTDALGRGLSGPGVVPAEGACLFVMERESRATARGATILARIESVGATSEGYAIGDASDATTGNASSGSSGDVAIVSCAGAAQPGAVYIEHWTGRSLGADAPAAVAAGIAAARRSTVPIAKDATTVSVSVEPVSTERASTGRIRIVAVSADTQPAELMLVVHV